MGGPGSDKDQNYSGNGGQATGVPSACTSLLIQPVSEIVAPTRRNTRGCGSDLSRKLIMGRMAPDMWEIHEVREWHV
jgi:hypothetical protein